MKKFAVLFLAFMVYVQLLTIYFNLGHEFSMTQAMVPALGFLFIVLGFFLRKAKRNWFFGIRTPWTLSSENVWQKTHELGSKLFIISGAIALLGIIFPEIGIWLVLAPVLISTVALVVYSFLEYGKEKNQP